MVYDAEKDEFYKGTVGDIRPADAYGDKCSEIIVYNRYNNPIVIYVMNNRED